MIDLEYTEIDGLLYPNIQLDDAAVYDDLGKYGNLRLTYLHKQKPQTYRELFFTGKLAQHCAEVEKSSFEMAERDSLPLYKFHLLKPLQLLARGYLVTLGVLPKE